MSLHRAMAGREAFTTTSRVLMVDGRARGFILVAVDGDVASFEARAVDPAYRRGWANVLLMATDLVRGLALGVRRVRFYSSGANGDPPPDTMDGGRGAASATAPVSAACESVPGPLAIQTAPAKRPQGVS